MNFKGTIKSKMPKQETSIFAVMSALALEHNAINLSQGFPDFDISAQLIDLVQKYMKEGKKPVCSHDRHPGTPGADCH